MSAVWSWLRRWGVLIAIVGAVIGGVVGLGSAVGVWAAAAAAGLAVLTSRARFNEVAGRLIGAAIVGTLVLFAANIGLHKMGVRLPILWGLLWAVLLVGTPAAWYLRGRELGADAAWGRGSPWSWVAAVSVGSTMALLAIIDVPIIVAEGNDAWPVGACVVGAAVLAWVVGQYEGQLAGARWGAAVVGMLLVGGLPLGVIGGQENETASERTAVRHKIDIRIVTAQAPRHGRADLSAIRPDPALNGFDVRYSVGHREGARVRWTFVGASRRGAVRAIADGSRSRPRSFRPPATRKGAHAILVLLVDGTPPVLPQAGLPDRPGTANEVGVWRRLSHVARDPRMPSFALLQTSHRARSRARLRRWGRFTSTGGALPVNDLGRRSIPEAGLALALSAPSAREDLRLAVTHRPILLFDGTEPVPRPLSVEWLFAHKRVALCDNHSAGVIGDCPIVRDAKRLENGSTHLQIEQPSRKLLQRLAKQDEEEHTSPHNPPAPAARASAPATTIYVHPVSVDAGGKRLLYLDYWWYLADNPVPVGDGALCGAGLVIVRVTCHDHASDWEGLTVVIDRTTAQPRVVSVNYAQHDSVVRYEWAGLRKVWDENVASFPALRADHLNDRPLAYIANGTHSTYPLPCAAKPCRQVAGGPKDGRHNGKRAWLGNYDANTCQAAGCVQALPTTAGGQQPALWNAFRGAWGSDHCTLAYYCDSATPPPGPGKQGRYGFPADCDGTGTITVDARATSVAFKTTYARSRSCH